LVTESQAFLTVIACGYILAIAVVIHSYLKKDETGTHETKASEKERLGASFGALSLILFAIAVLTLGWILWLVWYDITVWSKSLSLIFFGDRTGEAMSLGIGMRGIHYVLVGSAFLLLGLVLRRRAGEVPRSPPNLQLLKYVPLVWLLPLGWCGYWGFLHDYLVWHKNIYQTIESQGYNMFGLFVSVAGLLLTHLLISPRLPQTSVTSITSTPPKPVEPVAAATPKNNKKGSSFGKFATTLTIKKEKQK